jgi:uncharacterized membrane protein
MLTITYAAVNTLTVLTILYSSLFIQKKAYCYLSIASSCIYLVLQSFTIRIIVSVPLAVAKL